MPTPDLHQTAATFATMLAFHCVRNSYLEDLHAGIFPSSQTGDYTDVKVVSPYGEIAWNRLGRISHAAPHTVVTTAPRGLHCGDVARGERPCQERQACLTMGCAMLRACAMLGGPPTGLPAGGTRGLAHEDVWLSGSRLEC